MIVVEVALKAARGMPPQVRLPLKAGLNVVRISERELRSGLLDAVYFPLFPDPARSSATAHLAAGRDSKALLTFYGRDKQGYRITRDLGTGSTRLYRFEAASKKYSLLTEVTQEAAQFVRVQQHLPDEVIYERLFVYDAAALPSQAERARTRSGAPLASMTGQEPDPFGGASHFGGASQFGGPPRRSHSASTQPPRGDSGFGSGLNMMNALVRSEVEGTATAPDPIEDLQSELKRLRKSLTVLASAGEAQDELDELVKRKAELQEKTEQLAQAESRYSQAERDVEAESALDAVPEGMFEKLESFGSVEQKYRADRDRAEQDQEYVAEARAQLGQASVASDPLLWSGVGIAALSIGGSFAFGIPWLALLNIVGAGAAGTAGIRHVNAKEDAAKLEARARSLDEKIARLDKAYDLDTAVSRRILSKLDATDPDELARRLAVYQELKRTLAEARRARDDLRSQPGMARAADELDEVSARVRQLETLVAGGSAAGESPDAIRRRISAIEAELESRGVKPAKILQGTGDIPPQRPGSMPSAPRRPSGSQGRPSATRPGHERADDEDDYGYGGSGSGGAGGPGGYETHPTGVGRSLLAMGPGFGGGSGFGGGGSGPYGGGGGTGSLPPAPDRSRDLMQAGAEMLQQPVEEFAPSIKGRVVQYVAAMTDQLFADCAFGPRGEVELVQRSGERMAYVRLEGETLDLVDVGLRFALAEAVATKVRVPLLVDDSFAGFPARRRALFVQMLQYLSKLTQVVVWTETDDIPGHRPALVRG